ncbi:MAG: hypothetical protein HRU22_07915 [Gammaproteobacteria bacterium]|nr:hypothetical protein [Gammaproteobacteria bacterium]
MQVSSPQELAAHIEQKNKGFDLNNARAEITAAKAPESVLSSSSKWQH